MEPLNQRLAAGEPAAFAELYDLCAVRCHHYLVVRLGNQEAADEVLQEVFVRLVRNRQRLAQVENLLGYVFTIARNEAARFAARHHKESQRRAELHAEDLFVEAISTNSELKETAEAIAAVLERLPMEQREVVELKIYGGLTFHEIAELLVLPQGTVATRYRTALERLRAMFVEKETSRGA